jgi:hypothetical protein
MRPVTDLPRPRAARLGRPGWLDPRLLLGVLLVLVSVVVGAKVVAEADDTYPVWAVSHDLGPRSSLVAGDLVVKRVRIEGDPSTYVSAVGLAPVGWVLSRAVAAGELLPRAALDEPGAVSTRRVAVPVEPVVAADLADGAVVDVYLVPRLDGPRTTSPPPVQRVLTGITVAKVERGGRGLAGSGARASVVLVLRSGTGDTAGSSTTSEPDEVTTFLEAQGRGSLQLVRAPAGSRP